MFASGHPPCSGEARATGSLRSSDLAHKLLTNAPTSATPPSDVSTSADPNTPNTNWKQPATHAATARPEDTGYAATGRNSGIPASKNTGPSGSPVTPAATSPSASFPERRSWSPPSANRLNPQRRRPDPGAPHQAARSGAVADRLPASGGPAGGGLRPAGRACLRRALGEAELLPGFEIISACAEYERRTDRSWIQ